MTTSNTILNQKPTQKQITQAIKYIKSDFPEQYNKWTQSPFQGQRQFESHLNTIEYVMTTQAYAKLRGRILDELLIKLRFFSFNQSYLIHFQAFLMQKFINFTSKSFKGIFNLVEIYGKTEERQKQHRQIAQRYSILTECLMNILKFCFAQTKSSRQRSQGEKVRFENEMLRRESQQLLKRDTAQIVSRQFATFLGQIVEQVMEDIFRYGILDVQKIYPLVFSTLVEGLLGFSRVGGSRFVEIVGAIVVRLMEQNRGNIWCESQSKDNDVKGDQLNRVKQLGKEIRNKIVLKTNKQKLSQHETNFAKQTSTPSPSPPEICKFRLLLFLQRLLTLLTGSKYDFNNNDNQGEQSQCRMVIEMVDESEAMSLSSNRINKWRKVVDKLLGVVVKGCFRQGNDEVLMSVKGMRKVEEVDNNILLCLVILSIFLNPSTSQSPSSQLESISSNFLSILSTSSPTFLPHTLSFIRRHLNQIFLTKFKELLNRNKTISTQKTLLLGQLSRLVEYVDFETMQWGQFIDVIGVRLKWLFCPDQNDMNRPLIIAIDNNNRLQGTNIAGQAVPLTPLQPFHSCFTYPITLPSLKQSLKFQQTRHILDEIRLFYWFQNEQVNFRLFKQLLTKIQFSAKLNLLQYFMQQLMRIKVLESESFYGLNMSLSKFYQLLIIEFYIDALLSQQSKILDHANYTQHKELYEKSILSKMQIIYELIVSNIDMKKLLISNKQEELVVFYSLRIMYNINRFLCEIKYMRKEISNREGRNKGKMSLLYRKAVLAENLILNLSHRTYLLQLFLTTCLLEFSAPRSISQTLKPLQSTLIHRNTPASNKKQCNLQFMRNLIKVSYLKHKQAQQLAQLYLSKAFITNHSANTIISLLFPYLNPQTMRKCLLSIKNWPVIFQSKSNIQLLNNQPLVNQPKEGLFHANDSDNVTVSNALGVVVLELGDKWVVGLELSNPRKQILIDAMINLIQVNDKLIFWKRFFFQRILSKLISILREISNFITQKVEPQTTVIRRVLLYQRLHIKIYQLLSSISDEHYKYSTQINQNIQSNLNQLKQILQKQYNYLKRQCFVHQRYQYLERYKQVNYLIEKIDLAISYKQLDITSSINNHNV